MGELVLHTCRVYFNPKKQAGYFFCSEPGQLAGMNRCGQPACDYVDIGNDRVWMCPEHLLCYQRMLGPSQRRGDQPWVCYFRNLTLDDYVECLGDLED